jgi:hypothetical protein
MIEMQIAATTLQGTLAIVCLERAPRRFAASAFDVAEDGSRVELARRLDVRQGNAVERLRSALMADLGLPSGVVLAVHPEFRREPVTGRC